MKNRVVLVTGGAGSIGSNLCKSLLALNATVICFDNFSSGSLDAIASFRNHPNFKLIGGDIRNIEKCRTIVKEVEYVFHFAGFNDHSSKVSDVCLVNEVNVIGFLNILTVLKESQVKGLLYPTSCSEYVNPIEILKNEELVHGEEPLSAYAISKYTNELHVDLFRKKYDLNIKGVAFNADFDKMKTVDVSNIIQLHIDALQGMFREEYQSA
jgi:UDP-N-acetylglucosamine 4-epimerase